MPGTEVLPVLPISRCTTIVEHSNSNKSGPMMSLSELIIDRMSSCEHGGDMLHSSGSESQFKA